MARGLRRMFGETPGYACSRIVSVPDSYVPKDYCVKGATQKEWDDAMWLPVKLDCTWDGQILIDSG